MSDRNERGLFRVLRAIVEGKRVADDIREGLGELGFWQSGGGQPIIDASAHYLGPAPVRQPDFDRLELPAGAPGDMGREPPVSEISHVATIDERVQLIVKLASEGKTHPRILEFVTRTLSRKCGSNWCVPEHDKWQEAQVLFRECKKHYRYLADPVNVDTFKAADRTLEWQGGDCDCWTILYASCAGAAGIEVAARVIHEHGQPTWNHIFPIIHVDGRWIAMDGTVSKPPGWHPPLAQIKRHRDFAIP